MKSNSFVMFAGTDSAADRGLWVSNGTAADTYELTGIAGAYGGGLFGGPTAFAPDFTSFNGEVVFRGLDANGDLGLWVTNGTAAGTYELTGINGANPGGLFSGLFPAFTVFNGEVLFSGIDAGGNYGLWVTNGTAAGTYEITGISSASPGGLFRGLNADMAVFNNEVLFAGIDAANQTGLWVTNGTAAGTSELTGINNAFTGSGGLFGGSPIGGFPTSGVAQPPDLTVFKNEVLFDGLDAAGENGLWVTNGTAAGTHELTGISGANAAGILPSHMTVFNNEVLFSGRDAAGNIGLWVTDETAAGTHELTGIKGTYSGGLNPFDFTVFKNELLFNGLDSSGEAGLWVTNGTARGTHELTGIKGADPSGLSPSDFTVFNNEVLFEGSDSSGERGLWVTNGTVAGTHEITGISGAFTGTIGPYNQPGGLNPNAATTVSLTDPASQLVQAIASFSPTGLGGGTAHPNQTQADVRLTDHLAPPHH
jgi:ELWxxDGT repeat protein